MTGDITRQEGTTARQSGKSARTGGVCHLSTGTTLHERRRCTRWAVRLLVWREYFDSW
jgi:hypothetical protein